jgi:hypothetical protein
MVKFLKGFILRAEKLTLKRELFYSIKILKTFKKEE